MNHDNLLMYKVWAPEGAVWTDWVKPVLFANMSYASTPGLSIPEVPLEQNFRQMIIVDLPGRESVEEALAFAGKGYRPVPLYNGTMGSGKMLVDVKEVSTALSAATDQLKNLALAPDLPPVFMLDSNRMKGAKTPGFYDNRWCVFAQDMPSAGYLKRQGIEKIVVRAAGELQMDLVRVLYAYQKAGISLYTLMQGETTPKEFTAKKQHPGKALGYRLKVTLGLTRNATGGFGGKIPEPYTSSSSSGGHYYRMG